MNMSTFNKTALTHTAIDALKNAYNESTSHQVKQSISTAYTAIMLLNYFFGTSDKIESMADADVSCDPSEYCAAI